MSTRQQDFQQKMAQLNAKAQASGKKTSTYDPYASPSSLRPSLFKQLFVFVFSMAVVTASRAVVFHKPEWFQVVFDNGIPVGAFADSWFPIAVGIIVSLVAGHSKDGLWVPDLLGFFVMFFGEDMFFIHQLPELWEMIYSPEYVAFVIERSGNLEFWMDGDRFFLPNGIEGRENSGIGTFLRDLISSITGNGDGAD